MVERYIGIVVASGSTPDKSNKMTLKEYRSKHFANGSVYAFKVFDKYPIETTDTFLPFYTKDAIGRKQNSLKSTDLGTRKDRWMIGVSVMSGCPVGCKFCATGQMNSCMALTSNEIVEQIKTIINMHKDINPSECKEFKINYTRMGEPFLNIEHVKKAISEINSLYPNTHHYISTIGIKDSDFDWIKDNITLQISLHSLDEKRRNELIPYENKMSIEELGKIRTRSNLKTTLNMTLVDWNDFDIKKLKQWFDPKHFFIKLSPINENEYSIANDLGKGVIEQINLL
jgi:molybdenum cofactor biosynthesis enzyme MoaA